LGITQTDGAKGVLVLVTNHGRVMGDSSCHGCRCRNRNRTLSGSVARALETPLLPTPAYSLILPTGVDRTKHPHRAGINDSPCSQPINRNSSRTVDRRAASPFLLYLRGMVALYAGKGEEAAAEFQKILDHKGRNWGPLYSTIYLRLPRAAALAGDTAKARRAYQDFLPVWKTPTKMLPS
jgi:hypothetical protein